MTVAVIGYGNMGRNHVRVLGEMGIKPIVVEPDRARWPGDAPCFPSIEATLLDEIVDAVIVASPTESHHRNAWAALTAGCAVLVEKPITSNLADAAELLGIAESHNLVLEVGLTERWNPAVRVLKQELSSRHPRLLSARRSGLPSPGVGQGVAAELATHDIDVLNWLVGPPLLVRGVMTGGSVVEAVLLYEDGALGSISADWLSPRKVRELRVLCDEGTYDLDYIRQSLSWHPIGGDPGPVPVVRGEPLRLELEHFLGRASDRSRPSAHTAESAIVAMQVVAQITGDAR